MSAPDRSFPSMGQLAKTPSEAPSVTPSIRTQSKKMKSSKSVISMKSSDMPKTESPYMGKRSSEVAETSKLEKPRACDCAPDLYTRVLGPTADETFLTGLQTVIDLCNRLRVCGDGDESGEEEPERDQGEFHRGNNIITNFQEVPEREIAAQIPSSRISYVPRKTVSAGFQVNPNVKHVGTQSMPFPQVVSQILQTGGLTPEMVSKVMQTSLTDISELRKASLISTNVQTSNATLKSNFMQTPSPDQKSGLVQTSSTLLIPILKKQHSSQLDILKPRIESTTSSKSRKDSVAQSEGSSSYSRTTQSDNKTDNRTTQSEDKATSEAKVQSEKNHTDSVTTQSDLIHAVNKETMSSKEKGLTDEKGTQSDLVLETKGDEHKCISTPEPPQEHDANCKCCECSSSTSKESKSSLAKRPCICGNRRTSRCRCGQQQRKHSKTVVSNSTTNKETTAPLEVKYAITRISTFKEFTTFEVMKSTKNQPRQIPKGIEGVFVLKRKNGRSDVDVKDSKNGKNSKNGSKTSNKRNGSGEKTGVGKTH